MWCEIMTMLCYVSSSHKKLLQLCWCSSEIQTLLPWRFSKLSWGLRFDFIVEWFWEADRRLKTEKQILIRRSELCERHLWLTDGGWVRIECWLVDELQVCRMTGSSRQVERQARSTHTHTQVALKTKLPDTCVDVLSVHQGVSGLSPLFGRLLIGPTVTLYRHLSNQEQDGRETLRNTRKRSGCVQIRFRLDTDY